MIQVRIFSYCKIYGFDGIVIEGLFLCSMQNGTINAYHGFAAREAFKKIPPFPRAREVIGTIKLSQTKAVTLDVSKR